MWLFLAILSAFFAALTTIFAKAGLEGINASLATAIRTCVVLAVSWGVVFLTGAQKGAAEVAGKSWFFLILSGVATGASWLCYYKALQMGGSLKGCADRQAERCDHLFARHYFFTRTDHGEVCCRLRFDLPWRIAGGAVKGVIRRKSLDSV